MKDLRIEITDAGTGLYVAVDPDGIWARTTRPDELVTVDWDAQGRVIGIEVIGAPARQAVTALARSLAEYPLADDPGAIAAALTALLPPDELQSTSPHEAPVDTVAAQTISRARSLADT